MNITDVFNTLITILNEMSPYVLLGFLFAGILHAFVRTELMTTHLSGNGISQSLKAAILGVPLPLCSCGVLPTAISLRRKGASISATSSFLIATPQTGIDSIVATYSLLGLGFAIVRPVAAFVTAILGGTIIGQLSKECDTKANCYNNPAYDTTPIKTGLLNRTVEAVRYGFVDMVGSVGKWLVCGLVIAALITVLVPDNLFIGLANHPLLAMIAVVVIAIPMYVCATGSIPIAMSLMLKGLTPGVALVFLMAGPAVNFASFTMLSRSLGRKATICYILVIALSAIAIGSLIDLMPRAWFYTSVSFAYDCCHVNHNVWFSTICSIVLLCLLLYTLIVKPIVSKKNAVNKKQVTTYGIGGIMCAHCKATVEKGLSEIYGVKSVHVDISTGLTSVEGAHYAEDVKRTVEQLGYDFNGIIIEADSSKK